MRRDVNRNPRCGAQRRGRTGVRRLRHRLKAISMVLGDHDQRANATAGRQQPVAMKIAEESEYSMLRAR